MSIFWTFSACIGHGSGQFRWTLTNQRQSLDVIQSEVAVRNVTRFDAIWMKRSSSGVGFFTFCPNSDGLQQTLFSQYDLFFGKQLFYEYQNEQQHIKLIMKLIMKPASAMLITQLRSSPVGFCDSTYQHFIKFPLLVTCLLPSDLVRRKIEKVPRDTS